MPHNNNSDESNNVHDLNLPDMIVEFWFSLEPPAAYFTEMRLLLQVDKVDMVAETVAGRESPTAKVTRMRSTFLVNLSQYSIRLLYDPVSFCFNF